MAAPLLTEESIREETAIQDTLRNIKHVIIVMSGKGGVGKSTVSSNLAMSLSMKGYKTGVMDIDITGPNIPKMFAVEDRQLEVENGKLILETIEQYMGTEKGRRLLLPARGAWWGAPWGRGSRF